MSSKLTQRKKADDKGKKGDVAAAGDEDKIRYTKMIEELAEKTPANVQPFVVKAAPVIAQLLVLLLMALPYIMKAWTVTSAFVAKLPENVLYASLGFCVCFFGGVFPATIAAFEAWRLCGGMEALQHVREVWEELSKVQKASAEDDKKDENNDGVADVNQVTAKELVARKSLLALKTVEPERMSSALTGIYTGWIGVVAVLKVQFAKTVTLGEVIGEKLYHFASQSEPAIKKVVQEEYHKWVPLGVRWACKAVAISVAWFLTRIASAVHSSIRGGQTFAFYVKLILAEKGIKLPEALQGEHVLGWVMAGSGLVFQFMCGFSVPFPLNLVLWPLNIVEWFVVYSVSS